MDKTKLRKQMIQQLQTLPNSTKKAIENNLRKQLFSTSIWQNAQTVGITLAQSFEWDTKNIIKKAWNQNKNVAIPKVNQSDNSLTFYYIQQFNELTTGYQNILEPNLQLNLNIVHKDNINLLIVPGLHFDKSGYRIGFGGGYYDRYLADYHHPTISLVSEQQLIDSIQPEKHDIPVEYLITENSIIQTKLNSN